MMKNFILTYACSLDRGLQGLASVRDNDVVGPSLFDLPLFLVSARTFRCLPDAFFACLRGVNLEVVNEGH
ncbi:TPA: hypothetical protein ACGT9I_001295 [Salmonella enterica]|uniref:Uncharacterized protein n=1 Tax=Salmonella enterica I TaxID=59201 RepID=A0A612KT82_SALET|nr:hypothetical protein [Salmonella enterica subsp. enterica]EHJ3658772.1 hypothetical protein [Salmonella enterica]HDN4849997.1 hypothetical protein [Salmonella enterica subsp. enterica serovar Bovismorbificans]HDO5800012.1 hypothetical protein [Salmonella enterica subsp. enterica serovar Typhimurium]HEC7107659.1 hypothetical protein [Salmonella enterica subsp. enterica serovar Mississippi]HED0199528.1 hypothetical protein [Salmonella enterica subsp. enterica serovar Orientalis]